MEHVTNQNCPEVLAKQSETKEEEVDALQGGLLGARQDYQVSCVLFYCHGSLLFFTK